MIVPLLLLGPFVGILSSFFGVGGGILIVPALYTLFPEVPPQTVISCSLGVIFLNSITNTITFLRIDRRPNWTLSALLGFGLAGGILIGWALANALQPSTVKLSFGIVITLIMFKILLSKAEDSNSPTWDYPNSIKNNSLTFIASLFGGAIAGVTGLGGGIILVPIMISLYRTPLNWIPPHTNPAMALGTLVGVIAYVMKVPDVPILVGTHFEKFQFGYLNIGVSLLIFVGAAMTSKIGANLSQRVRPIIAKRCFAALIAIVATRIFLTA